MIVANRKGPKLVGNKDTLLMRPLRNIDVSREGYEGLHQLRIFRDETPGVEPNSGIMVLLVNQQQRGTAELQQHHPAWYTGSIELDAVPVRFIDLDKLYYALELAKRLQARYEAPDASAIRHAARIKVKVEP